MNKARCRRLSLGDWKNFSNSWTLYTFGRRTGFFIWGKACSRAAVGRWSTVPKKKRRPLTATMSELQASFLTRNRCRR